MKTLWGSIYFCIMIVCISSEQRLSQFSFSATSSGYVLLKPGISLMGSPPTEDGRSKKEDIERLHEVKITKTFLMKITEVTQKEWQNLMKNNPSGFSECGETCPVERVSWFDALAYANALSIKENLEICYNLSECFGVPGSSDDPYQCSNNLIFDLSCEGYRLPTEAEWEYAYRAESITRFYNGNTTQDLDRIAWHGEKAPFVEDQPVGMTHPVAQKEPNKWGLFDMSGNVREWVWDVRIPYSKDPQIDPVISKANHNDRVVRGGSWYDSAIDCRAASRSSGQPPLTVNARIGFRLVRTVESAK